MKYHLCDAEQVKRLRNVCRKCVNKIDVVKTIYCSKFRTDSLVFLCDKCDKLKANLPHDEQVSQPQDTIF